MGYRAKRRLWFGLDDTRLHGARNQLSGACEKCIKPNPAVFSSNRFHPNIRYSIDGNWSFRTSQSTLPDTDVLRPQRSTSMRRLVAKQQYPDSLADLFTV